MQLVEGSEVRVNCGSCGAHQFTVTVIEGYQKIKCPKCRGQTVVTFERDKDGHFKMYSS